MPKSRGKAARDDVSLTAQSRHDAIRARAYELYLERGDGPGDDVSDWLQAEQEYRARSAASPANGDERDEATAR